MQSRSKQRGMPEHGVPRGLLGQLLIRLHPPARPGVPPGAGRRRCAKPGIEGRSPPLNVVTSIVVPTDAETGGTVMTIANLEPWIVLQVFRDGVRQPNGGWFVCAEGGGGHEVVANRSKVGPWEVFRTVWLPEKRLALRAFNGQWSCPVLTDT